MKCLILAGGKGNSLWPLSREEYPKQFMQIRKNRSLLQETIARNIPFCDEFLIATNKSYHFIVEGQMKAFQGLKYQCILEEEGRKTAPAIAIACMNLNPSELVFVVSSDQIIEGGEYKESIIKGKMLAKEGKLVTFGTEVLSAHTGYGYIRYDNNQVLEYREKPDEVTAGRYYRSGEYLWNSGNFLFSAGDFLNELKKTAPEVYYACKHAKNKVQRKKSNIILEQQVMEKIPAISVEKAVFERSDNVAVVKASFCWWDAGNFEVISPFMQYAEENNTIIEQCENAVILNRSERQLIVANGVNDIAIINTEDACYVTNTKSDFSIKQIMQKHPEFSHYFEKSNVVYRPWGTYEILSFTANYKVKKVVVYPGKSLTTHKHALRSEQWSVVQGCATVVLDDQIQELPMYCSLEVPAGVKHRLANASDDDLVIIEVSFGPQITEDDKESVIDSDTTVKTKEDFIKCEPIFKDYLWGGTKLRDIYGKNCEYDNIAESWELSAHESGQCRVGSGRYKGMLFAEYVNLIGEDALGWKCQVFEKFPLLIKFIDAREQLSVQVHPDDGYALSNENEYGKSEMWYIVDCEPNASIYYGFKHNITQEELKQRALDNTIIEVLNEVTVKKGDTFFIEAGTVHAIGKGILICEIQQNSNCTYRLYDYARKDKYGNLRELHLDKAVAVIDVTGESNMPSECMVVNGDGYHAKVLCECKYFTSIKYTIYEKTKVFIDETSFVSIVIISGSGSLHGENTSMPFVAGESFFVHAGKKEIEISGKCEVILTHI